LIPQREAKPEEREENPYGGLGQRGPGWKKCEKNLTPTNEGANGRKDTRVIHHGRKMSIKRK